MKHNYYMEWWTLGDKVDTPEPGTFSLHPNSLKYFLKRFINGKDKRQIIFLQDTSTKRIIVDKSNVVIAARGIEQPTSS